MPVRMDVAMSWRQDRCLSGTCLDGICVHPGRGNFTVDYPYLIPERAEGKTVKTDDPGATERLAHSSYWNYLGTVRGAQRQIRELGDKPL